MKILWVCNIMLPVIAEQLGKEASNKEGWLTGLSNLILHDGPGSGLVLSVCFPVLPGAPLVKGKAGKLEYYSFYEDTVHEERYDSSMEDSIKRIIEVCKPDLVHIFGTEFGHSYAAAKAFANPDRTLVGLQGICYECAKVYAAGLPQKIKNRSTLRDFLKNDNIRKQQEKFIMRGEREKKLLKLVGHVTGRTLFDKKAALNVNQNLKYHFMNETLRTSFYEGRWSIATAEKHTLFMSQGNYPLKGLHIMLKAMSELKEEYPDVHLYVAGDVITAHDTFKEKLKIGSYGKYLLELIKNYGLSDHITFEGKMDAKQMKQRFLRVQAYVCPSILENSSNSMGEAMLLGLPVIASRTGGIPSMAEDKKEALLVTPLSSEELADAVRRIFEEPILCKRLSECARMRAVKTHNPRENYRKLAEIYAVMTRR